MSVNITHDFIFYYKVSCNFWVNPNIHSAYIKLKIVLAKCTTSLICTLYLLFNIYAFYFGYIIVNTDKDPVLVSD